ncbi:FkbW [Alloactinosynnema sp. L-07]|uniref:3-hydroxybutyrate oligomer hydrolase family protein n=1 Tax=Alloactinosynnema sp. L-07 TaxID=1653480 RepID=UPI00065F029E|nr:3-hydroxybutyrate oligomer hydrolase family protein [Alloactinosynnema sp. L-07]CRK60021.1 FkbW [Alloactinosynnema sp. L-07]
MFTRIALAVLGLVAVGVTPAAATVHSGHCAGFDRLLVPGVARQVVSCLDDVTTTGTAASGHTVPGDWAGLTSAGLPRVATVPGIQVDGHFPDTSTSNTHHGWNSDAQFVVRLPDEWNGGLVVSGSPGNRRQYANDRAIADQVLAAGYAFAATDKGNTGLGFHADGRRPGDAVAEWNSRVTQLTVAAKIVVAQRYGQFPARTLMAGISNGGYLVRWQLENRPWLYDGGVDWEGTLWTERGPNLLTFLPPALAAYPAYRAGDQTAHQRMLDAGFAAGSEFLWDLHYRVYWDLTQRLYREEVDPDFDGALVAGIPFCAGGTPTCDTDYDYLSRPRKVHTAVERISLTGRIGKPLITLHGTLDALLPISQTADTYARMITDKGRGASHRYFRVVDGNHVDGFADAFTGRLRPIAPCFHAAITALDGWLDGRGAPRSATIPRTSSVDEATTCALA